MSNKDKKQELLGMVNSPEQLRQLHKEQLPLLAEQIRERIIDVVMDTGGHLASNLGVVELTLSLHRVFESPKDMIFWDVGHQCYTHKILTGRNDQFHTIRQKDGLSGFPKKSESEHDILETGHASTAVSAGVGALAGKRAQGDSGKVIVVVGDGALTGGMAYEGLNYAGHLGKDLIIVYNDNNMSISKNIGGISNNSNLSKLSAYVTRITMTPFYQNIRDKLDRGIQGIPILGYKLYELFVRLKRAIKAAILKETLFSEMGFEYIGPVDGHSISRLSDAFENAKMIGKPVVIHAITQKGRGYKLAENNPSQYHGVSPLQHTGDKVEKKLSLNYTEVFAQSLVKEASQDKRVVGVSAAMADGTGMSHFKQYFPERFYDVGIAEQHGVTFSAGLAISGLKPVTAIYSTFMQRAVDQVIHDVALQKLPVVFAMDRSGLVGDDGETHQGLFDIAIFKTVPGLSFLAPADANEMESMLSWALRQEGAVMLRYPKSVCPEAEIPLGAPIEIGRGVMAHKDEGDALLVSVGGLYQEAKEAVRLLAMEGIPVDHYNLRFIKPIDEEALIETFSRYSKVYMVEDGAVAGGIGETVASILTRHKLNIDFQWAGVADTFLSQASRKELLQMCHLDSVALAAQLRSMLSASFSVVKTLDDTALSS